MNYDTIISHSSSQVHRLLQAASSSSEDDQTGLTTIEMLGIIIGAASFIIFSLCVVFTVYSFIFYQLSKKKLAMNLSEAEEKI